MATAAAPLPTILVAEDDRALRTLISRGLASKYTVVADTKLKGVPILFLTARTSPADVVQGISLGARHYMTKPFKMQELLERIEKLLK